MESFKFEIDDYFKLSTGMIAITGVMKPADYPLVTSKEYVIEIKSESGKVMRILDINEDIFVRQEPIKDYSKRSFQTRVNILEFVENMKEDPIYLNGYPKDKST